MRKGVAMRNRTGKIVDMSEQQFTPTLREYTKRKPFIPFIVEMADGRRLVIEEPFVVFGGGAAGYISDKDGLVDIPCEQVRSILPVTVETKL